MKKYHFRRNIIEELTEFSDIIYDQRVTKRLSLLQAGGKMGILPMRLSQLECNIAIPDDTEIEKIADFYGIEKSKLVKTAKAVIYGGNENMADSAEKIYIGSGKEKTFTSGGSVINASVCLDGLKGYFEKYGFTTKGGKHMLKINISKRKDPGTYGETHSITIDTWKPDTPQQGTDGIPD